MPSIVLPQLDSFNCYNLSKATNKIIDKILILANYEISIHIVANCQQVSREKQETK